MRLGDLKGSGFNLAPFPLRPKKALGQHFLIWKEAMERIVELAELMKDDHVIEIGTGTGELTLLIASKAHHVWTIEIDSELVRVLHDRFKDANNITLINEDALNYDYSSHKKPERGHLKVMGNLPFYISSQILIRLVEHTEGLERMVLTLQKEVADRLVARSSTKEFGIITLLVSPFYEIKKEFTLPPEAFYPRPKVNSSVVTFIRKEKPSIEKELWSPYRRAIKAAFSQRRKMLKNALLKLTDPPVPSERIEKMLDAAGIDPGKRGESLGVEEFRRISMEIKRMGI